MPEMLWLIVVAVVGVAVGFVISRYLVNASSGKGLKRPSSLSAMRNARLKRCVAKRSSKRKTKSSR